MDQSARATGCNRLNQRAAFLLSLRTGLRAILPPMEAAPERARHLLESVLSPM
jgi:hypothetical protein